MDPNEALKKIREAFQRYNAAMTDEAAMVAAGEAQDAFEGLDGWLKAGGFFPADWTKNR
jgi:hypothetical protein